MKRHRCIFVGIFLFILTFLAAPAEATELSLAPMLGYNSGLGFQLSALTSDFAQGFPFKVKFSIGYTSIQPGNALQARKIFINDATNGIPEKKGWVWDFRLNLLHKFRKNTYVYGGVRYSLYTGNFVFVGGNEDFDVTSKQWGFGGGLEAHFRMSSRINLIVSPGIDYFLPSKLNGHDTAYSPDGENVNPRLDYTYQDADKAINQPKLVFRMLIGFSYRFRS